MKRAQLWVNLNNEFIKPAHGFENHSHLDCQGMLTFRWRPLFSPKPVFFFQFQAKRQEVQLLFLFFLFSEQTSTHRGQLHSVLGKSHCSIFSVYRHIFDPATTAWSFIHPPFFTQPTIYPARATSPLAFCVSLLLILSSSNFFALLCKTSAFWNILVTTKKFNV